LLAEANKLDVDVLCWGGTHRFDAYEYGDKFFVNPGSATGAFSTRWLAEGEDLVPSFCLMDVSTFTFPVSCANRQWNLSLPMSEVKSKNQPPRLRHPGKPIQIKPKA